jgi:hypothetical protein
MSGTNPQSAWFRREGENALCPKQNATVKLILARNTSKLPSGDLRKIYGADFAKGCADDEKIPDVLRKRPSLRNVIRHHEAKRFEKL